MRELLVVVPTYNEAASLPTIIERISAAMPAADILVVDDGSPDGTGRIADTIAVRFQHVSVLHRPEKRGLGAAYIAGFRSAIQGGYPFVAEIDADGSHDPIELPAMVALAASGADLVIGSRWVTGGSVRNWPAYRRAISRAGNRYSRWALGSDIHDLTAGFRVYRTERLSALDLASVSSQGYCFQVELASRLERSGCAVVEHPIAFVERVDGRSKMHAGKVGS